MIKVRKEKSAFFLFLVLGFLVFFAQTKDFKLLVDGLTYAALSKNILKTGDWKTLHYGLEQYSNFYQHPPLAMWIQALVYKVFGFSEAISRYFPSLCALGTLLCVFTYVKKKVGVSGAYFASLALLTSTRFVKWGTNFYLDGIFAFFCFVGFCLWMNDLKAEQKNTLHSVCAGVLFAFAFMTKGILIFGPLTVVMGSLVLFRSAKNGLQFLAFAAGCAFPILLWTQLFGGDVYLSHYIQESVLSRVGGGGFNPHPWRNIFLLWWPWWPIFFWAVVRLLPWDSEKVLFALAALSFPVGFTINNGYLEHYLTPFYPFAAVVIGIQFAKWIPELSDRWLERTWLLTGIAGVYLATVSPSVNQMKETSVQEWVRQLELLPKETKPQIQQVAFTDASADIWYGLANILGKTDWQAIGAFALNRAPLPHSLLITKDSETPDSAWQIAPCLQVRGFHFYTSPDLKVCSQ